MVAGKIDPEASYTKAAKLFDLVQCNDVKLLRASELARFFVKGQLKQLRRQDLENSHPEIFADEVLVERCLWEAEAAAAYPGCAYPGCVVLSYCWQTGRHPDPSGSMCRQLAVVLHWYAAQRARWTRERLYTYLKAAGHTFYDEFDFDWDFVVLIDFWCLYQVPRTEEEGISFRRALRSMNEWYGHRGTTVLLASAHPKDWEKSEEFQDRGRYGERGWPMFEQGVASLFKGRGMCLDLGGFEAMLEEALAFCKENQVMERYGWRAGQLTGRFAGARTEVMQQLAMDDFGGLVAHDSCLRWLVEGRQVVPLAASEMEAALQGKRWSDAADLGPCMDMYREALAATFKRRLWLEYTQMTHWTEPEWGSLGALMGHCEALQQLNLQDCGMGDGGLRALAARLEPASLPHLEKLNLRGNDIGEAGLDALGEALARGAMPKLKRLVVAMDSEHMKAGWEQRLSSAVLARVSSEGGTLDIARGSCRCAVS